MTENNAAQPGLKDAVNILRALRGYLKSHRINGPTMLCTDGKALNNADDEVLRALEILVPLSKLRAEGVQAGEQTGLYVEARECKECGHIGINDSSDTQAACTNCDWSGDSPTEDHCPGCAQDGTMTAACPKCGGQYSLLTDRTISAALASAPVAGVAQPVATLHDDGYYTWHGAKPQGYEQAGWRMKVYAAPQDSEAVPLADCYSNNDGDSWLDCPDDIEFVHGLKVGDEYELKASIWAWPERFRVTKVPDDTSDDYEVEPVSARALKTQADKDGGDCAKGAGDAEDAARYRLAASDCILILRGDAALGRAEWDRKLDRLATQKGEK